jgi:uncharacterized protein with NAD-binding domain and iron-sulfur cluster
MNIMIKQQKQEALEKRHLDQIDRQNKIKAQMEEKLARESYEQMMYEQEVARMEREEEELINRLKQTKTLESEAAR